KLERDMKSQLERLGVLRLDAKNRPAAQLDYESKEKALEQYKEKMRPIVRKQLEERYAADRVAFVNDLEEEVTSQDRLTAQLRERVDAEHKGHLESGDKSLELEFARSELSKSEEISQRIADRIIHLQTESRAPGQIQILDTAKLPQFPDGPTLVKK